VSCEVIGKLPESPLERAKRLHRELVEVDTLVGITERVPWQPIETQSGWVRRRRCA